MAPVSAVTNLFARVGWRNDRLGGLACSLKARGNIGAYDVKFILSPALAFGARLLQKNT